MGFRDFKSAVAAQFQAMSQLGLYRVQVDKDKLWETYLGSFPEGTNPVYQKRTEHDCSACRSFIRAVGGLVSIVNGQLVSVWDIQVSDHYQVVTEAMSALVKSCAIDNKFLTTETSAGVNKNIQLGADQQTVSFEHFFVNIPKQYIKKGDQIGPALSDARAAHDVMLRGLKEISTGAIDTVLELIGQNSIYRGEEHKFAIEAFQNLKGETAGLPEAALDLYCWVTPSNVPGSVARTRNTSIGTLLTDLSEGKDLEEAVKSFEKIMAPANYKRPTALVTPAMIKKAQEKVEELGYMSALERRYARIEDITVNNILFADRSAKKAMNVFEELAATTPEKSRNFDKVEEVSIEKFISDILPKAQSLEVLFENRHAGNLVSLIAPADPTAKNMFKWDNKFSWSYTGDVADSIKARVKAAGGTVTGDLRCSLSWSNYDDLDLHMVEPGGSRYSGEICYSNKVSLQTGGNLDVDMNAGGPKSRTPVENIIYPDRRRMIEGMYRLYVNNFCQREMTDVGFEVEVEFDGKTLYFAYDKAVKDCENIDVITLKYTQKSGFEVVKSLPSTTISKTMWSMASETFQKVKVVMLSPNHWEKEMKAMAAGGAPVSAGPAPSVGNKHYFFMLDGCQNDGKARGFYNEFLKSELEEHRKVFEMVGAKMKTDESEHQLSGLGFSSTQRNHIMARVTGNVTRVVKVVF